MISEWRSMMDNLKEAYYLVKFIVMQILMFLQGFILYEFTWFAPTEEDLNNANSKIHGIAPQRTNADFFVLFIVCGLLFAFMILSTNSPKDEDSSYETTDIEMIPMSFEQQSSSLWFPESTSLQSIKCFHHTCGDCVNLRHVNRNIHTVSQADKRRILQKSRSLTYSARTSNSQHFQKTEKVRSVSQMTPKDWLIRRTRSGHIYGKYPV